MKLGFLRKRTKKIEIPPDPNEGLFHQVWGRKRLPGPGAMNYALESLALAPFPVSGPTVAVRQPRMVTQAPQEYVMQAVMIAGVPTQAGQILAQPLYDPALGTANGMQATSRLPYERHGIQPAGSIMV